MKISILSPGRPGPSRDPQPITLSTSLSRRLRNSRSIKGGASPAMFPTTAKKRGSGFENPEPSSPKVTCIGQVRVKSKKKHAKNLRTLSRRRSSGEVSFRKLEHSRDGFGSQSQHLGSNYQQGGHNQYQNQECLPGQRNNQRWVHLPLTICEALRAFGSEFSCLFPCRSSCSSTTAMEKGEKMVAGSVEEGNRHGSCGAVFARWLVALQDGDGGGRDPGDGGGREIKLVAGDDNDDENEEMGVGSLRRHVFQDLEIVNDSIMGSNDEARVSICVPPKNALLLMRCRSDPMKMEALTNRFWEPTVDKNVEEDEDEDEEKTEANKIHQQDLQLQKDEDVMAFDEVNDQERDDSQEDAFSQGKVETNLEMEMKQCIQEEDDQEQSIEANEEEDDKKQSMETTEEEEDQKQSIETTEEEDESMFLWFLFEENADQDQELEEEEEEDSDMEDAQEELFEDEDVQETEAGESNIEKVTDFEEQNEEKMVTEFTERFETPDETHKEVVIESEEVENGVLERENKERDNNSSSSKPLPDCLLLMMYEPKLSMEVSKETWVCSTDFIRRHSSRKKPPPPPVNLIGQDESKVNASTPVMRMASVQYQPGWHQPARSSCSFPARPSMATILEQKLVNTIRYEPLVLKRCKSEPMRNASSKLAPETCFWKNKLEPPRRASFGIGLAGLGF